MVKKSVAPLVLLACSMMLAACDTTPPTVSVLMKQIAQACQDRSKDEIRSCIAKEGVTADQIDQSVGGWDAYLDKGEGWTYTGIKYVSMADAPNNKSILPEMITSAQGGSFGGVKTTPNLKVLGFILVSYKQPDGTQAGETVDVGIASDGTAKIVTESVKAL